MILTNISITKEVGFIYYISRITLINYQKGSIIGNGGGKNGGGNGLLEWESKG